MSAPSLLTPDQTDALQEVTNIAMGQAGSSLANILGVFVNLSVPRIRVLDAASIGAAISDMVGRDKEITAARQSFHGTMRGEALVIYDQEGCMDLADLMGYDGQLLGPTLLVAPGDPEREELRVPLRSWSPVVRQPLPFPSILLGSHDDPYCSFERAQGFAQSWGSTFVDYGQRGHINAESGLGDWPEGHALLQGLMAAPNIKKGS